MLYSFTFVETQSQFLAEKTIRKQSNFWLARKLLPPRENYFLMCLLLKSDPPSGLVLQQGWSSRKQSTVCKSQRVKKSPRKHLIHYREFPPHGNQPIKHPRNTGVVHSPSPSWPVTALSNFFRFFCSSLSRSFSPLCPRCPLSVFPSVPPLFFSLVLEVRVHPLDYIRKY